MARKSGQNQGSITRRKNGSYMVQLTVDGKRVTKYFKTKKEANAWRIESLHKIQSGLFYAGPRLTLSEFFEEWLIARTDSIKPKTLFQYRQIVEQHINPTLGNIKVNELQPAQIQALYNNKVESGTNVRTVRLIHSVLHCALNHALRLGIIYRNPSDAVYKPTIKKREMQVLDEQQVRSLLIAARGNRLEMLYKVAITTGLRKGELLALKWSDLDWDTHQLNVQRQVQRVPGKGLIYTQPKTEAGRRTIILGSDTIVGLKEHQKRQWHEKEFMGDRWQECDLIFPCTIGTPFSQSNLNRNYKQC